MGNKNKKRRRNEKKSKKKTDARHLPIIPVTILSGFLGSGKTTLLQRISTSKAHQLKIAVIVNDMAELNIDAQTILRTSATKKDVVKLENGCICCTLRGDLIREIYNIQQMQQFDYVLIESTGIAEPQQVAESFCVDPETMALATAQEGDDDNHNETAQLALQATAARLDTCVTVIDAVNFPRYLSSLKRFQDVFADGLDDAEEGEGEKSISELMVEQVEFANVVVINKIDLVSPKRLNIAKRLVKSLNPKARVICGAYGDIDLHQILNTNMFNMQEASESRGWLLSLKNGVDASEGEADEYGVTSFVYRERKPFHPKRLYSFLTQFFCFAEDWNSNKLSLEATDDKDDDENGYNDNDNDDNDELVKKFGAILRSKGSCWIAGRDDHEIGWAQSGRIIQLSPNATWYCKTPLEEWQGVESDEDRDRIQQTLLNTADDHGHLIPYEYGDRRQELVFIGTNLQKETIEQGLNQCLLTANEMSRHTDALPVGTYPDPLHPILVTCGGAQSLFLIARAGQNQHIRVLPGSLLTIQNVALHINNEDDEESIRAVKVWLDKSDDVRQGLLLATLRPNTYEQHAMSLDLLPCDEEGGEAVTNRRIRLEIVHRKRVTKGVGSPKKEDDWMMACEVHMMGKVEPVPYSEDLDEEEDDEKEDDCDMDGACNM